MIQLVFDASTAGAGARAGAGRGRLQPARGRRARRVGRRQARAGRRHASRRAPGRRLARELLRRGALSRQLGGGGRRLRRHARADPRRPARGADDPERLGSARAPTIPWIAFEGRWGELQPAFFNGPTGPNLKTQWTHPIALGGGLADARATRFPEAACSARAPRTSSAAPSRTGRGRSCGSWRTRSSSASCSARSSSSSSSCSRGRGGARRRRSASPAGARGDRSSRRLARMYVVARTAVRRDGPALRADLAARDAPAGARPARDERPRRPDGRGERAGSSPSSCSRSERR